MDYNEEGNAYCTIIKDKDCKAIFEVFLYESLPEGYYGKTETEVFYSADFKAVVKDLFNQNGETFSKEFSIELLEGKDFDEPTYDEFEDQAI